MPSERVQRQIDSLLDKAEAAVNCLDWEAVPETVSVAFAIDSKSCARTPGDHNTTSRG